MAISRRSAWTLWLGRETSSRSRWTLTPPILSSEVLALVSRTSSLRASERMGCAFSDLLLRALDPCCEESCIEREDCPAMACVVLQPEKPAAVSLPTPNLLRIANFTGEIPNAAFSISYSSVAPSSMHCSCALVVKNVAPSGAESHTNRSASPPPWRQRDKKTRQYVYICGGFRAFTGTACIFSAIQTPRE